ncbi:MAG: hypothetical protein WCJ47_04080 [Methanomicrobiales archaeon]
MVSAGHCPDAYAGSRYIIEEIKKRCPDLEERADK